MAKILTHRKSCRMCNSRSVKPVLRYTPIPAEQHFVPMAKELTPEQLLPLTVSVCEKCRLVQQLDVVSPEILYRNYPHASFTTPDITRHYETFAQEAVGKARLQRGDLVVDIGCGDGALLRAFRKLGMKVAGIDPSAHAAAQARADNIPIYPDVFTPLLASTVAKEHGHASLITANFVLGSIDNLHALFSGARHILKPEGLFIIEEPYLADVLQKNLFDAVTHERLSFITAASFEPFLRSVQMHLIDVKRDSFRQGILRAMVQRSDGPHVVSSALAGFIADEIKAGYHTVESLTAFAERTEKVKARLKTMVSDLKASGKKVAGYGASGRTLTFVHECGWQKDTLEFIVDDNPYKHDLLLAGTDIRVVHPNALRDRKPDHVILFAYNHLAHLMQQQADYLKSGGRFITPFPEPAIL